MAEERVEQVDDDRLLTTAEVAQHWLRCHSQSLVRWRSEQRGPAFVTVGRRIFYRAGDVRAWLRLQTVGCRR